MLVILSGFFFEFMSISSITLNGMEVRMPFCIVDINEWKMQMEQGVN